jgi:hypothetical protein
MASRIEGTKPNVGDGIRAEKNGRDMPKTVTINNYENSKMLVC